jgi:hypothetical protein
MKGGLLLRVLSALMVLLVIAEPMFWRGLLEIAPGTEQVRALRQQPNAEKLTAIARWSLQAIPVPIGSDAVTMAERLLRGEDLLWGTAGAAYALPFNPKARAADLHLRQMQLRTYSRVAYSMPFAERDLIREDGIGPLPYASLYLVDVFLSAHASTAGDLRYLGGARDALLAFLAYEAKRWRPRGFLWNDHAIAARAGVLARFWAAYRSSPIYDDEVAQQLLNGVARTLALLAASRDFNVRTNHGVMQNVALMQLVQAFPGFDSDGSRWRIAHDRLATQVPFLYSEDGFVLEHSAHYHAMGVYFLGAAIALTEAANKSVPPLWLERLTTARVRLTQLTRPDGTLPAYGDTEVEFWPPGSEPTTTRPAAFEGALAFPLAGYGLSSYRAPIASHSVLAWSYFPAHGHKLADEASLIVWAGRGWVTNTGYWLYGGWGRRDAEGWRGSNGPHWLGEATDAKRRSSLLRFARADDAAYFALQRTAPDDARITREVVHLAQGLWLVVDAARGRPESTQTLWTFFPDLELRSEGEGLYRVLDPQGKAMSVSLRSTATLGLERVKGSRKPFGGWVAVGHEGVPAWALSVQAPTGATTATLFALGDQGKFAFASSGYGNWTAEGKHWRIERDGDQLRVTRAERQITLAAVPVADPAAARLELTRQLARAVERYPREPDFDTYRLRLLGLLLAAFALQELVLFWLAAKRSRGALWALSSCVAIAWLAAGTWIHVYYLQPHWSADVIARMSNDG